MRTYHGQQEEDIWISVFTEPFSSYVGDHDQVINCGLQNKELELQDDDIIFDSDGRDHVPKEVLLFRKEASGYICLAVVSVYPRELNPPISKDEKDEEVPPPEKFS